MADLTKSLLDAISIIADKTVDEISSDETIKAAIKKVINTSEGKYLVNYNNGDFYAYKQSGSTDLYQTGEQVYVLIPKGDMSQKKFIIGRVEDDKKYSAFLYLPDFISAAGCRADWTRFQSSASNRPNAENVNGRRTFSGIVPYHLGVFQKNGHRR